MTLIGYTMMCVQTGPRQLVREPRAAVADNREIEAGLLGQSPGGTKVPPREVVRGCCP
jgi:hypothetical protein